ncbi:MAG: hypothetical protein ACYDEJ_16070 [Desulfitobacteriaceae bacterium]
MDSFRNLVLKILKERGGGGLVGTANPCGYRPPLPTTPLSFSILVSSPIRCNLPFSPVSALILPLAKTNLYFSGLLVAGLDILTTFLFKWSLAHPPSPNRVHPDHYPVTLSMSQLTQLMQAIANGQIPLPSPISRGNGSPLGQGLGPVGIDQPLFPDNLSVSLMVSAPFAPFDSSPDTSFNVPLFEIPGVPGNLIIALGLLVAQFLLERAGVGTPGCQPN